ncbi:uncharacterized protein IUM83_13081 [Phytophthora cinnamomi]|uniref:uncharacterized protein n=1 Tax=Phytophthora cinnamomi TaxID=4785 RepID=UPI003559807B|nr:hypothetical protein IUM83_13081 [Phytophthora cinnamomi]
MVLRTPSFVCECTSGSCIAGLSACLSRKLHSAISLASSVSALAAPASYNEPTTWCAKKRDLEAKYSTDIPGGAEVFISRVTGLKLYPDSPAPDQMAQGNAARVELVTKIDLNSDGDDDSTTDQPLAATSQGTEGNVTDRDRPTPKKRARVTGKQQAGPDENKKTRSTASKQEKLP